MFRVSGVNRKNWVIAFIVMGMFLTGGCTVKYPAQFATMNEVYASASLANIPKDLPPDSSKKGFFEAPYEDVFQAVKAAATQAQFEIASADEKSGVILTNRSLWTANAVGSVGGSATRVYSYAIFLKEIGPESTEVTIIAKLQDSCYRFSGGFWTTMSIISVGIMAPTALIAVPMEAKKCRKVSTVRWAKDSENSLQEMSQLITFARNNLIAAGAL